MVSDTAMGYLINFMENGSWYSVCILATFATMLVYGIFLAVSRAFYLKQMEITSKSEIIQAVATLFMIVIVISSLQMAEEFAVKHFLGTQSYVECGGEQKFIVCDPSEPNCNPETQLGDGDVIKNVIGIVQCRFAESALTVQDIQAQIKAYANHGYSNVFVSRSLLMSAFGVQFFSGSWVDALHKEAEQYRLMNNYSTNVLIKVDIVLLLLRLISESMLSVFLPVGLFLRAFPPTRGIGAFFISTAIGFYFIFPVLFVVIDPGFVQVPENLELASLENQESFSCYPTFEGASAQISKSTLTSAFHVSSIQEAAKNIAKFNVFITTHPFVVFVITVIFIRYMTYILGGQSYAIMRYLAKVI